jgi:nucleotide-binding universal stress UspA family protein
MIEELIDQIEEWRRDADLTVLTSRAHARGT